MRGERKGRLTLFLAGDVMLGRGVDQILPHPSDPTLREAYVEDARCYVGLAETANGPIPRPVAFSWPWGDALDVLAEHAVDVRVMNLETSVTRSHEFAPDKQLHYRMSPDNLPCLSAVRPDACVLANNHVLDLGLGGLDETLDTLDGAGIRHCGAGPDADRAWPPAAVPIDGGRVLVFSFGMPSAGVPPQWAAGDRRSGVNFVAEPSEDAARALAARMGSVKGPGDIVVASIHWGSNWGYRVPRDHVRFAHVLIDNGVDVVHGHSSHHPRPIEVYRDRLILYGCGDLINDYEGIGGHERYRDDLRLMYLVQVEGGTGALAGMSMVAMQARQMRLRHAPSADAQWLRSTLDAVSSGFGARIDSGPQGTLALRKA